MKRVIVTLTAVLLITSSQVFADTPVKIGMITTLTTYLERIYGMDFCLLWSRKEENLEEYR